VQALSDTFLAALRTLGANRLRSVLTLFGIIIGIVAVVAMSAVMAGMRDGMIKGLEQLGTGVFQVQKWPVGFGPRNQAKFERRKNFKLSDVFLLQQHCQTCQRVGGEAWEFGQSVTAGGKTRHNL